MHVEPLSWASRWRRKSTALSSGRVLVTSALLARYVERCRMRLAHRHATPLLYVCTAVRVGLSPTERNQACSGCGGAKALLAKNALYARAHPPTRSLALCNASQPRCPTIVTTPAHEKPSVYLGEIQAGRVCGATAAADTYSS